MTASRSSRGAGAASPSSRRTSSGAVTAQVLEKLRADFGGNDVNRVMQNAVTQVSVEKLALRRDLVVEADHSFSIKLDDWKVTAQKRSGRCWLFAGLNLLRAGAMKKMNLKNFEFSQNWPMFWDKLEKANHFLEAILETADRPLGDRTVDFLLAHPVDDGGQWNMFVNIVRKYGLVPKAAMPETESSSNTRAMNRALVAKLRQGAKTLRDLVAAGSAPRARQAAKHDILTAVHRMLSIHLGDPPASFDWQWYDKNKVFHRDANMTPQTFARKYVTLPLDEYVCLVHDPRPSNPPGRTYTVEHLGNVVGGEPVVYLNVGIDLMKAITLRTLRDGEPVWFGCDCGKQMEREQGLWDAELRDYGSIYNTDFTLDKASRLHYGATCMTHAMLFTGVDVVDDTPRRWRVENSWGEENGNKGWYLMNDSWFDEHMFEIAARREHLPADLAEALDLEPVVLPAWDPMGSLARGPGCRRKGART